MPRSIRSLSLGAFAMALSFLFQLVTTAPHLHAHVHRHHTSVARPVSASAGSVVAPRPDKCFGNVTCSSTGGPDIQPRDVTTSEAMPEGYNEYVALRASDPLTVAPSGALREPSVSATLALTTVVDDTGSGYIMQPHLRLYQTASIASTPPLPSMAYSGTETSPSAATPSNDPKPIMSQTAAPVANAKATKIYNGKGTTKNSW